MAERKPLTLRQIKQAVRSLERKGLIVKKRDALGNVVMRPGKDGKPEVVCGWRSPAAAADHPRH
jgi:hypothetical protein